MLLWVMRSVDKKGEFNASQCQVYSTGRGLVLSEPSVVVYDKNSEKIRAIGEEARQMTGHVTSSM